MHTKVYHMFVFLDVCDASFPASIWITLQKKKTNRLMSEQSAASNHKITKHNLYVFEEKAKYLVNCNMLLQYYLVG